MDKSKKVILALLVTIFILSICCSNLIAFAATDTVAAADLDSTTIEDDLGDLDVTLYPYNPFGKPRIISFQEYCFSTKSLILRDYCLYVYVYNPTEKQISVNQDNAVNIAVAYNEKGEPSRYENLLLEFLDCTDDFLFYKFKISNSLLLLSAQNKNYENLGLRRYDVASLQLRFSDGKVVNDTSVSKTYIWTGFGKGCAGENTESSLECKETALETLSLDVKSTYYRPEGTNGKGKYTQDCLVSVYFAVPNSILQQYGSLYRIHAHWLEALTKPILVVGNMDVYKDTLPYVGQPSSKVKDNLVWQFLGAYVAGGNGASDGTCDLAFNTDSVTKAFRELDYLDYLFYAANASSNSYSVSSETLRTWMIDYADKYGYNNLILGKYSDCLFAEVNEEMTEIEISADDTYTLTSEVLSQSFLDWLFGIDRVVSSELFEGIKAIYPVSDSDFKDNYLDTCKNLFVSPTDYYDFKQYYDDAKNKDQTVFLFRFAQDEYFAQEASYRNAKNAFNSGSNCYFAQETVYLDFDIIDVTFRSENEELTVIPVVMSPFDIIPDITPPVYTTDDGLFDLLKGILQMVLTILLAIVVIWLLCKIIPAIARPIRRAIERKRNKNKR